MSDEPAPDDDDLLFTGMQLYRDPDTHELRCRLFQRGMITELKPSINDAARPLGFYDFNNQPVPDPFDTEGNQ